MSNFHEGKTQTACPLEHLPDHVVQDASMLEVHKLHLRVKTHLDLEARLAFNLRPMGRKEALVCVCVWAWTGACGMHACAS